MEAERPDWRKSYHETFHSTIEELRWCRENNVDRRIECGFTTYRVGDMTDRQIEQVSLVWAERDVNRAIRQHNAKL